MKTIATEAVSKNRTQEMEEIIILYIIEEMYTSV